MPWRPEDWEGWLERPVPAPTDAPEHLLALSRLLRRIPDPSRKRAIDLGGASAAFPFLGDRFADVRRLRDGRTSGPVDVGIAVDPPAASRAADLRTWLELARTQLVEGGILVASFVAAASAAGPLYLWLAGSRRAGGPSGVSEVDLQYRLHCAGFAGVRLRRFERGSNGGEALVLMAVRRASN